MTLHVSCPLKVKLNHQYTQTMLDKMFHGSIDALLTYFSGRNLS